MAKRMNIEIGKEHGTRAFGVSKFLALVFTHQKRQAIRFALGLICGWWSDFSNLTRWAVQTLSPNDLSKCVGRFPRFGTTAAST
jgi:hypothetical protein